MFSQLQNPGTGKHCFTSIFATTDYNLTSPWILGYCEKIL